MGSSSHSDTPDQPLAVEPVPNVFPKIEGAEIAADSVGERIGGDFYDSIRVSPERILFGLLDVAGRRKDNRGILIAAQETFRKLGAELFSAPDVNESDAMSELCLRINRRVIEVSSGVHSCPAFIGCYHEKFGTLCYTNAGHTPGLLRDNEAVSELASTGLPLGLFSHSPFDAPTIGVAKGSALLLVSRGVVERDTDHNGSPEDLSLERIKNLFQQAHLSSAKDICAFILESAGKLSPENAGFDDRTALALVRTS